MPIANRPGDVLADRYLLVDLLSESGGGRFWRAHDRVLDRHVAVHVIPADDKRAEDLMDAARRSATVADRHVLRVLDVDLRADVCYVVNEWGEGTSLDVLVGNEGTVGARRAAWITAEVGSAIAAAHAADVAHGRLVPENVLIDTSGSVRVIGLSVEAALLGLPAGRRTTDVADLAGLLYFLLTGTWPGVSRSAVPAAPHQNGRVLRPRQVKAGVPRQLDLLCDRVINIDGTPGPTASAAEIAEELREFVGDPAGLAVPAAAMVAQQPRNLPPLPPMPVREPDPAPDPGPEAPVEPVAEEPVAEEPAAVEPVPTVAVPVLEPDAVPEPGPEPDREPVPPTGPRDIVDQPTQAGVPIFHDEDDDVSWLTARAETPPPPPPFEDPPERPLFAPAPAQGEPARRARPGAHAAGEYWPWESSGTGAGTGSGVLPAFTDDDEPDDGVPGRSWMRLAAAIAASLLLLLAVVFAFDLGRGGSPLGLADEDPTPSGEGSSSPTTTPTPVALTGLTATDLDPQGDPPEENPDIAGDAVDGDNGTAWVTSTYTQQLGPTGLKTGVGLLVDLGGQVDVSEVDLVLDGAPTDVSLYLTDDRPRDVEGLTAVDEIEGAGKRETVTLEEPTNAQYLVVWLTSLPSVPDGFRGGVAEVVVRGPA